MQCDHATLGRYFLEVEPGPEGAPPLLFTENETNAARLYGGANASPFVKDALHDCVVGGRADAVNPARVGTKCAAHQVLTLGSNPSRWPLPGAASTGSVTCIALALNMGTSSDALHRLAAARLKLLRHAESAAGNPAATRGCRDGPQAADDLPALGEVAPETLPALAATNDRAAARMANLDNLSALPSADRIALRLDVYLVAETLNRMHKAKQLPAALENKDTADYQKSLQSMTNFIPLWVKIAVSLALGLGTMSSAGSASS